MAVLSRVGIRNQAEFDTPERVNHRLDGWVLCGTALAHSSSPSSLCRAAVEIQVTYVLIFVARPGVTSVVNPIPRPAKREWHLDREHRRAALGRPLKTLTRESPSGETPRQRRPSDGFAFQCSASHFPFEVMVSTVPTRQYVHHRHSCYTLPLWSMVLVLSAQHANRRRSAPYITS